MAFCKNCGKEIEDRAVVCVHCGVSQETKPEVVDNGGFAWGLLGYCVLLVGLILFLVPICARCTGELVGIIIAIFSCFFFRLPVWISLLLLIPMIVDGTIQMKTVYESNSRRRFLTGFLFGYGLAMLFVITSIKTFVLGRIAASRL